MVKALVVAALAWPLLLGASLWQRQGGERAAWSSIVYLAASRICHQIPARSFHSGGAQWPVCARCAGLYLSAPVGALAAALSLRRRRGAESRRAIAWLVVAAVPTAMTLGLEWAGLTPVTNMMRFVAAVPLGAMIAVVLVRTAAGRS